MIDQSPPADTSDICLLLRAHGEQHWLIYELVPVVRELEQRQSIPEAELGTALAYLEALWIEARMRAAETDAACAVLAAPGDWPDSALHEKARSYHAAVRRLRCALRSRVEPLLSAGTGVGVALADL